LEDIFCIFLDINSSRLKTVTERLQLSKQTMKTNRINEMNAIKQRPQNKKVQ